MIESTNRRVRRTKTSITNSIDQAAENEIAENGFISSLVTGIIRKAQIEPQVFYNRYNDIADFYDSFVKKYDSWLMDIVNDIEQPLSSEDGMMTLFRKVLTRLSQNPVALEIIRWELFKKNPTTLRTSSAREKSTRPLQEEIIQSFSNTDIDILTIFALFIGGIYYLSMHSKLAPFYGLDLATEDGRNRVADAVDSLVHMVYAAKTAKDREAKLKDRMRQIGIGDDVIRAVFTETEED